MEYAYIPGCFNWTSVRGCSRRDVQAALSAPAACDTASTIIAYAPTAVSVRGRPAERPLANSLLVKRCTSCTQIKLSIIPPNGRVLNGKGQREINDAAPCARLILGCLSSALEQTFHQRAHILDDLRDTLATRQFANSALCSDRVYSVVSKCFQRCMNLLPV